MQTTQTLKFVRKPCTLAEVLSEDGGAHRINVIKTQPLSTAEYDELADNLLASRAWLAGLGGIIDGAAQCVAVTAPDRATVFINPEGSDYARYVALAA